jgi:hypothetical protein
MQCAWADLIQHLEDRRDHHLWLLVLDGMAGVGNQPVASSGRQGSVGVMRRNPHIPEKLCNLLVEFRDLGRFSMDRPQREISH